MPHPSRCCNLSLVSVSSIYVGIAAHARGIKGRLMKGGSVVRGRDTWDTRGNVDERIRGISIHDGICIRHSCPRGECG